MRSASDGRGGHRLVPQPKAAVQAPRGMVPVVDHQRCRLVAVQGLGQEEPGDVAAQALPARLGMDGDPGQQRDGRRGPGQRAGG
jgi:hypothetical protein